LALALAGATEDDVMRRWQAVMAHQYMGALRRRFFLQLKFFLYRLSPNGYMGLHLTIGILIIIGASWLFGGIALDVVTGDPLTILDKNIAEWFHEHRTPGMTVTMQFVTDLASSTWVTGVAILCALVVWWKRCWYRLLTMGLVLPGGMILSFLLKIAFHRNRPGFEDSLLIFSGYSFPSGHTMAATLLYGLLTVFTVMALETWRRRVGIVLGAIVMIVLVGFSRVYLGAHYLSDVLGATAAGLAWLALSLTAVDTLRRNRGRLRQAVG
jgi:membrane-associated phospholipid phosphatase